VADCLQARLALEACCWLAGGCKRDWRHETRGVCGALAAALPAGGGPEAARAAARLAEALTQKLLALDAVEVGAAHRGARRAEIDRINRLCEALEARRP